MSFERSQHAIHNAIYCSMIKQIIKLQCLFAIQAINTFSYHPCIFNKLGISSTLLCKNWVTDSSEKKKSWYNNINVTPSTSTQFKLSMLIIFCTVYSQSWHFIQVAKMWSIRDNLGCYSFAHISETNKDRTIIFSVLYLVLVNLSLCANCVTFYLKCNVLAFGPTGRITISCVCTSLASI